MVPKRGRQENRRRLRDELRETRPEIAAKTEAKPWYEDPDGPCGSDDFAIFDWSWLVEPDNTEHGWRSHVHISELPFLKSQMVGTLRRHSVSGVDNEDWIDYSFDLKTSYALSVLISKGLVPSDSILANDDARPALSDVDDDPDQFPGGAAPLP